jgi:prenyltransferase beta subunit
MKHQLHFADQCVKTYDGGMAESPFCEAHGMYFFHLLITILLLTMTFSRPHLLCRWCAIFPWPIITGYKKDSRFFS